MPRIHPVVAAEAEPAAARLLASVKRKMGMVPNLVATMAHSPAADNAYLGFSQSLATGSLPPRIREQIALVVAETNQCDYCLAAHTALGQKAGLTAEETVDARRGESHDAKQRAAIVFARQLVTDRGHVSDDAIRDLRQAGYTEGEIAEIVAHVAVNIFTNYFNHVAETDIDFAAAAALSTA